MDIRTRKCADAEALIRWHHQEMGHMQPSKFIPADESSLILSLDEWVLSMACQQMKLRLEAGLDLGSLAVNLPGEQIAMGNS